MTMLKAQERIAKLYGLDAKKVTRARMSMSPKMTTGGGLSVKAAVAPVSTDSILVGANRLRDNMVRTVRQARLAFASWRDCRNARKEIGRVELLAHGGKFGSRPAPL